MEQSNDKLIPCPKCQGVCYEQQVSPEVKTMKCMNCGFETNSLLTKGSEFYNQQQEFLPELYKDLAIEIDGLVWYPTYVNNEKGMVFMKGSCKEDAKWAATKSYIDKDGKRKMDLQNIKLFEEKEFADAVAYVFGN